MEEAFMALLLSDPALVALVGTRVHWDQLPERVAGRPYIALSLISTPDAYHFEGRAEWAQWEVQADIWGETAGQVARVDRALRARLSGYAGTVSGVTFQGIFIDRARGDGATGIGGDGQLHRRSLDINISWCEG